MPPGPRSVEASESLHLSVSKNWNASRFPLTERAALHARSPQPLRDQPGRCAGCLQVAWVPERRFSAAPGDLMRRGSSGQSRQTAGDAASEMSQETEIRCKPLKVTESTLTFRANLVSEIDFFISTSNAPVRLWVTTQ